MEGLITCVGTHLCSRLLLYIIGYLRALMLSVQKIKKKKNWGKSWTLFFFPLSIHSSVAWVTVTDAEPQFRVSEG